MKIHGAVLRDAGRTTPYAASRPLDVVELDLDAPDPGELLIKIDAAGLCHSDLSVVDGVRPRQLPMLLGHEASGTVAELGPGVNDLSIGDRVVTVFLPRCEECDACSSDGRLPCATGSASNAAGELPAGGHRLSLDGEPILHHLGVSAFASHAVVDRRSVVKVGHDVPPQLASLLGCAVLTGGGAVLNAAQLEPGRDVIIVGLGGVGMAALLTARAVTQHRGGRVIGVEANPAKHPVARDLGADEVLTPEDAAAAGIRAPYVIEAAGHPRAFETAVELTAPGGITVTTGLPAPEARSSISPLTITAEAKRIVGSYLGSSVPARDIPIFERMWREGRLPVEKLASATLPLTSINRALDALGTGAAIRQMISFDQQD